MKLRLQGERTNLTISLRDERELELSVLPYMTSTEQIDGVVLRFFDATELIEDTKAPLQEKIKLIERLSEIAPDALFIHNVVENRSIYSIHSKTTAEQLGYGPEEWRPKEKGFLLSKVHPEDVDKVFEFRQALEQSPDGTRKQFNFRFQHKKGHWLWFQTNGIVAERNPDGSLKTIMGYQRSIEHQKNLERYSEYSSVLFELSQDCLKIIDENGAITEMSPNGCRLMEIDDFAAIKGKAWSSLWPEPSQVEAALAEANEKGFSRFEAFCPTAKGTPKWWDVQVMRTVQPHSDQLGFLSSSRDITKFKQLEETYKAKAQLEERLEFVERLHEGSPSIMYIYDVPEDRNVYATGDVLDMLGYSPEELQALGPGVLAKLMHPKDLALLAAHQKNLSDDGDGKQHIFDYRLKHQQGHWVQLRSIDSVFERDEKSSVKRILGHVINLDELRSDVGKDAAEEEASAN